MNCGERTWSKDCEESLQRKTFFSSVVKCAHTACQKGRALGTGTPQPDQAEECGALEFQPTTSGMSRGFKLLGQERFPNSVPHQNG